ncbi:hypothetical protein NUU61_005110 [Penicillium alfredii]|uniref:Uncharacterized protein n=1 Tax=Penicillium alfredii TaxID=1506179 RepID=A0A9W9F8Y9_9EURO|nr:uncharacterized protein NUU61_005110 [Penicillium alfredii]KAJ5095754.1 hypothetical protein NUU61_005110 [Penicillium alfredii]
MVPGPWKSSAHMPWCWLTSDQDNRRSCDEEGTPPNLNDPEVEFWCLNIDIDGAQNDKGKHGGCFVDG